MEEIWKDIPGYEKYYMASTLGRIKSKDRVIKTVLKGKEIKYIKRGRIMTPCLNSGKYLGLPINTDKLKKSENVHRLIAITFLPNPNNLPCVNHKDENKSNNDVSNLEWCTIKYNNNYNSRQIKIGSKRKNPVLQCRLDGNIINRFESVTTAAIATNSCKRYIIDCCNQKLCKYKNYIWRYENEIV